RASRTGCAPATTRAMRNAPAGAHPVGDPLGCCMRSIGLRAQAALLQQPAPCGTLLQEPTLWATRSDAACEASGFAHRLRSCNNPRHAERSCRSPPCGRPARMLHAKHRASRTGCAPATTRAMRNAPVGAHPVGDPRGCCTRSIGLRAQGALLQQPATCGTLLQEPTLWATRADVARE